MVNCLFNLYVFDENKKMSMSMSIVERKRKGNKSTPSPEGTMTKLQEPRLALSQTND